MSGTIRAIARLQRLAIGGSAALAMMVAAPASARAQAARIGQVKTAAGDAAIVRADSRLKAKPGDPVFNQDTIETGSDGSIGITFIDNTVLSTGPDSAVALEDYTFDSNNFTGSMLAEMRKGTLSVISGDIARSSPGAMRIKTPDAILGVRGTRFVVQVPG